MHTKYFALQVTENGLEVVPLIGADNWEDVQEMTREMGAVVYTIDKNDLYRLKVSAVQALGVP